MEEKKNIEQQLREHLFNEKVPVSPDVWENVGKELFPKKGITFLWKWLFCLGMVIGLILFLFFINVDHSSGFKANLVSNETSKELVFKVKVLNSNHSVQSQPTLNDKVLNKTQSDSKEDLGLVNTKNKSKPIADHSVLINSRKKIKNNSVGRDDYLKEYSSKSKKIIIEDKDTLLSLGLDLTQSSVDSIESQHKNNAKENVETNTLVNKEKKKEIELIERFEKTSLKKQNHVKDTLFSLNDSSLMSLSTEEVKSIGNTPRKIKNRIRRSFMQFYGGYNFYNFKNNFIDLGYFNQFKLEDLGYSLGVNVGYFSNPYFIPFVGINYNKYNSSLERDFYVRESAVADFLDLGTPFTLNDLYLGSDSCDCYLLDDENISFSASIIQLRLGSNISVLNRGRTNLFVSVAGNYILQKNISIISEFINHKGVEVQSKFAADLGLGQSVAVNERLSLFGSVNYYFLLNRDAAEYHVDHEELKVNIGVGWSF